MALSEEQLNAALVGDTGAFIAPDFVVALRSLAAWPVDAFFVDFTLPSEPVVGWLNGDSIGTATARDVAGGVTITANVRPVRRIEAARFDVNVIPDAAAPRYVAHRALTLEFVGGDEPIAVDVGAQTTQHTRREANNFVSLVLSKLASEGAAPVT